MKKNILPLLPDTHYHIYNRGINRENLFKEKSNYHYFLKLYFKYIDPIAYTYSYCLLKNHFHLLIKTKDDATLRNIRHFKKEYNPGQIISMQFSHMFNSYAQAINKRFLRTGGLFETPFRRVEISEESYLLQLVRYIHLNPEKHLFINDFTAYPYSSYRNLIGRKSKLLDKQTVMEWFGGQDAFEEYHKELKG
jgi:REP element-mobilizing transposase RayT